MGSFRIEAEKNRFDQMFVHGAMFYITQIYEKSTSLHLLICTIIKQNDDFGDLALSYDSFSFLDYR